MLSRAQAAISQSESITRQMMCTRDACAAESSPDLEGASPGAQPEQVLQIGATGSAAVQPEAASLTGLTDRLHDLASQHCSTLQHLFSLRVQQLVLRKQQVCALHAILVAQAELPNTEARHVVRMLLAVLVNICAILGCDHVPMPLVLASQIAAAVQFSVHMRMLLHASTHAPRADAHPSH